MTTDRSEAVMADIRARAREFLQLPDVGGFWAPLYHDGSFAVHCWGTILFAPPNVKPERTLCGIEKTLPETWSMRSDTRQCEQCRDICARPMAHALLELAERAFAEGVDAEKAARDLEDQHYSSFGRGGAPYLRPTLLGAPPWVIERLGKIFEDPGVWLAVPGAAWGSITPATLVARGLVTWEEICKRVEQMWAEGKIAAAG